MCFEIFMPDVRETEISLTMFFHGKKNKITLPPHDFKVYNLKSWVTINDDKFLIWGLLWKLNRMMFWKNSFFEKKCDLTVKSDLLNVMFWRNWLSSGFWKRREKQFALICVLKKKIMLRICVWKSQFEEKIRNESIKHHVLDRRQSSSWCHEESGNWI